MQIKYKYLIAVSMAFAFAVIALNGLRIRWTEEGVLYALYGGVIGFYLAIAISMLLVWLMRRK